MIFYSTYDILDEVIYKKGLKGIIIDVQFTLDDETGTVGESYGIQFENNTYKMFIDPQDLSYAAPVPQTSLS